MTPPATLTRTQADLVLAITRLTKSMGVPPTFRELADELGVTVNSISELVERCQSAGVVTKYEKRARTLRVVGKWRCER